MFTRKHKKGFTLVEMLIVIVIIGILASALIPRLMSARGRANDTARKADLQQVATAIISYQIDKGEFPPVDGPLSAIKDDLTDGGLSSVPSDPDGNTIFTGIDFTTGHVAGEYEFIKIYKNGFEGGGFVIMAKTETENGSNYIYDGTTVINYLSNYDGIELCKEFESYPGSNTCDNTNGICTYDPNKGCLRYIYKY